MNTSMFFLSFINPSTPRQTRQKSPDLVPYSRPYHDYLCTRLKYSTMILRG